MDWEREPTTASLFIPWSEMQEGSIQPWLSNECAYPLAQAANVRDLRLLDGILKPMREHHGEGLWATLASESTLKQLPATLGTGMVLAVINALLSIALMSLIFRGELQDALPVGIGVGLIASAIIGIVIALGSSFPGMYAGIQDASAAILAVSAASIATTLVGPEAIDTVFAMIAATSLATGLVFLLMGHYSLGDIARFVPFPVIGGILAGTGYLILAGSIGILGLGSLRDLTTEAALGLAWPGVVLAALFFIASRRSWPSRVYLLLLLCAIFGFHAVTQTVGVDQATSLARGWLLGPFPNGELWPILITQALAGAEWGAIAGEAASLATILLVVPITLLLYISALEIQTKRDLDMKVELKTTGWANLASAAVGGPPGYVYLADTLITSQLVGKRRAPAVVSGLVLLGIVAIGGSALELLPEFVVGGLLLFVGIDFLVEWLWTARRRMTRIDYSLMAGIVLIIATVGFLPGVTVGLVAAVALFVVRYSRTDVVKHSLTGREHQSNIERPPLHAEFLVQNGGSVLVLELQGFIFFGTAGRIVKQMRFGLEDEAKPRFVILDFRLVTGVDSSAVVLFERIALLAQDQGLTLILTGLRSPQRGQFSELIAAYTDVVRYEADLDHGVAWCEDRLLEDAEISDMEGGALPLGLAHELGPLLESRTLPAGHYLMREGDPTPGIFLIKSGRATVLIGGPDRQEVRLRTLLEGTVLGEISLYRNEPCTATVVTDTECEVLHLTPEAFDDLCRNDPSLAATLHAFVARTLAGRVSYANRAIRALRG